MYVVGWDDYVAPLGLAGDAGLDQGAGARSSARRAAAHRELAKVLDSDACRRVIDELAHVAGRPRRRGAGRARRSARSSPERIEKAQEKVLTRRPGDHARVTRSSASTTCARTPSGCATCSSASGRCSPPTSRKAFVSQLKELQDNLGEHQDAEVHLAQLRDLAHDLHERAVVDTDALLAMGRLSDQLERRRTRGAGRVRQAVRPLRPQVQPQGARRRCSREVRTGVKVLATYSIKGGVGKTTTAVNLAYEAGRAGVRVLVWDLDPQGAATYLLRVRPKVRGGSRRLVSAKGALADHVRGTDLDAVHVLPADFSLRHLDVHLEGTREPTRRIAALLEPVRDHYDLAILDCPPSISLASESVFGAADTLLVPVVPATLASRTLAQLTTVPRRPARRAVGRAVPLDGRPAPAPAPRAGRLAGVGVAGAARHRHPRRRGDRADGRRSGRRSARYAPSSAAARAYRRLWGEVATSLWG